MGLDVSTSGSARVPDGDVRVSASGYLSSLNPYLADLAGRAFAPRQPETEMTLRVDADWFIEFFEVSDEATVAQTRTAWQLLALHNLLQDHRLDGDLTDASLAFGSDLLGNLLVADGVGMLSRVAGHAPEFWDDVHRVYDDFAWAYANEAKLGQHFAVPPSDEFVSLIVDRVAPLRLPASALSCHTGRRDRYAAVCRAIGQSIFAGQLRDDLSDWRVDHARGRPTYVLLRAAHRAGAPLSECTADRLADALYLEGVLEELLAHIRTHTDRALSEVTGMPHRSFAAYLRRLREESSAIAERVAARRSASA
jgi:hypothetical protein